MQTKYRSLRKRKRSWRSERVSICDTLRDVVRRTGRVEERNKRSCRSWMVVKKGKENTLGRRERYRSAERKKLR